MSYVGWDWASQAHDVTALDVVGVVLDRCASPMPRPAGRWTWAACAVTVSPAACW